MTDWKHVKDLHEALKSAGVENYKTLKNFYYKWLYKFERYGWLICRRAGQGRGRRVFTEKEIQEIIKEWSDGGSRRWKFK